MLFEKKEYCSGVESRFLCPFALSINCACLVSNWKQTKRNKVPRNSTYLLLFVEVDFILEEPLGENKNPSKTSVFFIVFQLK